MNTVLALKGKGAGRADEVSVHHFDTAAEAERFVAAVKNTEAKYWMTAGVVQEGMGYETYRDAFE